MVASAGSKDRPAYRGYHILWQAIDWIFPPSCGGCSALGERWCLACQASCIRVSTSICPRCANYWPGRGLCPACRKHPPAYTQLRSWGVYSGPLRKAIHRLKYQRDLGLGEALAVHLIELYSLSNWNTEMVIPVPLNPARLQQRGYNQANLLARPLALATGQIYLPRTLQRVRNTRSQVGLTALERHKNVENAFAAQPAKVQGRRVLLVDDVTTTSATLNACAGALLQAGADAVYALTLARAWLHAHNTETPDEKGRVLLSG